MPNRLPRDPREVHDQIIAHGLDGKSAEQLMALLVIELRRMREQLAQEADLRLNARRPG